jgi:hypothetical protein
MQKTYKIRPPMKNPIEECWEVVEFVMSKICIAPCMNFDYKRTITYYKRIIIANTFATVTIRRNDGAVCYINYNVQVRKR